MKTEIRAENEMKDSGIEYVGAIPKDWTTERIKNLFSERNERVDDAEPSELLSVSEYYGVAPRNEKINADIVLVRAESLQGYKRCEKNDLVSNIMLAWKGAMGISQYRGVVSPSYCVYTSKKDICSRYYHYLLRTDAYKGLFKKYSTGIIESRLRLYTEQFFARRIIVPGLPEQQAIADYLDEVCSKIDEIIAEAKASIEEYKELKQAVIFEAVTKGLDRNVEMKDSGYDFIGCIPAKWQMCKVRHLGVLQNGISIGGEAFGNGYPFVSYGDVYKNYSLPKTVDKLVRSSEEDRKRYSVERGDWFFTRTSETIDEIGFSCVCEETILDAVFAGFLIRVRPFNGKIYTGFAKYYFRSKHLRSFFVKEMNLVTRASLAQGLLKDAPVVFPPYNEQVEIANYLENRCEIIDSVIENKESTIADLEAYKKSLIYELVTGKRRVV